jgi:hypothetical protein
LREFTAGWPGGVIVRRVTGTIMAAAVQAAVQVAIQATMARAMAPASMFQVKYG